MVGAPSPDRWRCDQMWSSVVGNPCSQAISIIGLVRGGGSPTGSLRSLGCFGWARVSGWWRVLRPATGASVEMTVLVKVRGCSGEDSRCGAASLGPSTATAGQAAFVGVRACFGDPKTGRSGCEPPAKVRSPKPRRHLDRAFMAFGAPVA